MLRLPTPIRLLLAVGLCYGLTLALVRPMLQISDEVAYLGVAQHTALERLGDDAPGRAGVAPDETPLFLVTTWKPLYGMLAGGILTVFRGLDDPARAAVWLRLIFCLSIPAGILATYLLARHVAPANPLVLIGAPALVAFHPVFVSYGAAVTPDALANATGMAALLLAVRFADGTSRGWEPLALLATALAAIASKDTAYFLAALVPVALACRWHVRLIEGRTLPLAVPPQASLASRIGEACRRDHWLWALPAAAMATPVFGGALVSPYWAYVESPGQAATRLAFGATDVLVELWTQIPSYAASFWGSLGNFGATVVEMPAPFVSFWYGVSLAAAIGLALAALRASDEDERSRAVGRARLGVILLGLLLVALLAPLRQIVLGGADLFQGRWLFPMMSGIAVALTLGLSALVPQPWRLLPLLALALTAYAAVALLLVIIPYYYVSFPFALRESGLFLQGTFGRGADPARLAAFVTAAHEARPMALLYLAGAGLALSATAWGVIVFRRPGTAHGL